MKCTLIFTLLLAYCSLSHTASIKRHVQENADRELKQISFNSFIGNLENSLFESALSVNGASAPDIEVLEITPVHHDEQPGQHAISKRAEETQATTESIAAAAATAGAGQILVQTTKKVPTSEDGALPAHLIIDHVSVQPHNGGVPLLPTFQVHHTKVVSATIKEDPSNENSDAKQTKISITKTSITSTAAVETPEAASSSTSATSAAPSTSTNVSDSSTSAATTELPIVKLKKVEEQLKEKVAEVEAVPVILTARV